MDSAWPLLMFVAGLMGSGLLILICGVQTREEERAEDADLGVSPAPERSFFATLSAAFDVPAEVDEAVVESVQQHLRRQAEVATRFVERPSIVAFHDVAEDAVLKTEESLFQRIQSFLERERALAREFVSNPSLARLHGQLQPVTI